MDKFNFILEHKYKDYINIEKNNKILQDENDDFEFNQDIDYESEIKSPGWLRYQKRIKS